MYNVYLRYVGGRKNKRWKTTKQIEVMLSNGDTLKIASGFETDLSSVPKILWGIFPPFGDFLKASIIHDYLYIHKKYSRAVSDKEMLFQSNIYNTNTLDNYIRYWAVRLFGWTYWYR